MKKLLIVGAGGFGREMRAWCRQHPDHGRLWAFDAFLDDNPEALASFGSFAPVRPLASHRPAPDEVFVCGLGLPAVKERLVRPLLDRGAEFLTFVHPSVTLGERVTLGRGVVLCPGAVLSADIVLGEFAMVNLNSTVGHDARLGAWSTLSAQCDVTGHVRLGDRVFMGSKSTVIPRRSVGDGATVGAGAVVIADVPAGVTVVGNPARISLTLRKALLIFGSVLILGLMALVTAVSLTDVPRRFTGRVTDALPQEAAGWKRRDVPIAGTSAGAANVLGILNFSQAEQAMYEKDGRRVLVYAAYWEPGKVSVVDAGSHNPDSCWVNAGCVRTERRHSVVGLLAGRSLRPYEYGQYLVPGGGRQNVVFWHLVNGVPNRYEEQEAGWRDGLIGRLERLPLLLKDIREFGLNQKSEQMFIRVSFTPALPDAMADPDFVRLLQALAPLGIFEDQGWR